MSYFADVQWWQWHRARPEFAAFAGQKCTIENSGSLVDDPEVHMLHNDGLEGMSSRPNAIRTGQNSGYQALGIALAAGAARIVLVGYDMRFPDGKSHWHKGHPVFTGEAMYRDIYARYFKALAGKAEILNASPGSAIKCFPEVDLAGALSGS